MSEEARLEVDNDALQFEISLLRRENDRLVTTIRSLDARVALGDREVARLREYLTRVEHSLPWRLAQLLRSFIGRKW